MASALRPEACCFLGAFLVLGIGLTELDAQTTKQAESAESLVRKLGSGKYAVRQSAFQKLRAMEKDAVSALEKGLVHEDAEISRRCQMLLKYANRSLLDVQLDQFVREGPSKELPSFPGWKRFQKHFGNDYFSRSLYASMYRGDKRLLNLLEKKPADAVKLAMAKCNKIQQQLGTLRMKKKSKIDINEIANILFVMSDAPGSMDYQAFSRIYSILTRNEIQPTLMGNALTIKLIRHLMDNQSSDQRTWYQRRNIAQRYNLNDYIENKLRPEAMQEVTAALKNTKNISKIRSAVNKAKQVGLTPKTMDQIKPAMKKIANDAGKLDPTDNDFYAMVYLLQSLDMDDMLQKQVKPAFLKNLVKSYKKENNSSRIYRVMSIARIIDVEKQTKDLLTPVVTKRLKTVLKKPSQNELNQLYTETRLLNIKDATEKYLRPAAKKLIEEYVSNPDDLAKLRQASSLINRFNLNNIRTEKIEPLVQKQAEKLANNATDIGDVYELYQLANSMNMLPKIRQPMKKAFSEALKKQMKQPLNNNHTDVYRAMQLSRELKTDEVVPFAFKIAAAKNVNSHLRGTAVYMIGQNGKKDDVAKLRSLLKDKSSVGAHIVNNVRLNTQVRDVALAAILHIHGQSVRKFGFEYAVMLNRNFTNMSYNSFGFSSNANRQKAIKQFEDWEAEQKKEQTKKPSS